MKDFKLIIISSPLRDELKEELGIAENKIHFENNNVLFIQGYHITRGINNIEMYCQTISQILEHYQVNACQYFLFHYAGTVIDDFKKNGILLNFPNAKIAQYSSSGKQSIGYEDVKKIYKQILKVKGNIENITLQKVIGFYFKVDIALPFLYKVESGKNSVSIDDLCGFENFPEIKKIYDELTDDIVTEAQVKKLRDVILKTIV